MLLGDYKDILYLPLPRGKEFEKYTNLREKLRYKKEKYLEGVLNYGTVAEAMAFAGIKSRATLKKYRDTDEEFKKRELEYFTENDNFMVDVAEKQLFLQIKQGEGWAIKYFLDRRSDKYKPKGSMEIKDMTEIEKYRHELKQIGEYVKTKITTNPSGD